MKSLKSKLLSTTAVPFLVGAGIAVGGTFVLGGQGHALNLPAPHEKQLPIAKSRPGGVRLAACNPCAAKNPCNPCAAKNPCNPCAAKNPCNPCAAKNPCNPCAAKNPCNPCAAKNPQPVRGEESLQSLRRRRDGGLQRVLHSPPENGRTAKPMRGEEPMQPVRGEEPVQPLRGEEPLQSLQPLRRGSGA